jgi:hypothetical protein
LKKVCFVKVEGKLNLSMVPDSLTVACSLLKQFIREISDSLIPLNYFLELSSCKDISLIKTKIRTLPPQNLSCLKFLCEFLLKVAARSNQNKMDIRNIAIVFGPTVFRTRDGAEEFNDVIESSNLMSLILQNFETIFQSDGTSSYDSISSYGSNAMLSKIMEPEQRDFIATAVAEAVDKIISSNDSLSKRKTVTFAEDKTAQVSPLLSLQLVGPQMSLEKGSEPVQAMPTSLSNSSPLITAPVESNSSTIIPIKSEVEYPKNHTDTMQVLIDTNLTALAKLQAESDEITPITIKSKSLVGSPKKPLNSPNLRAPARPPPPPPISTKSKTTHETPSVTLQMIQEMTNSATSPIAFKKSTPVEQTKSATSSALDESTPIILSSITPVAESKHSTRTRPFSVINTSAEIMSMPITTNQATNNCSSNENLPLRVEINSKSSSSKDFSTAIQSPWSQSPLRKERRKIRETKTPLAKIKQDITQNNIQSTKELYMQLSSSIQKAKEQGLDESFIESQAKELETIKQTIKEWSRLLEYSHSSNLSTSQLTYEQAQAEKVRIKAEIEKIKTDENVSSI